MSKTKNRRSSSRDDAIKIKKNEIKINNKSNSSKKRYIRRKRNRKKIYFRRRLFLLFILLTFIFFSYKLISRAFGGYKDYTYPSFREEFLEDISTNIYTSSTQERSLSLAEKNDDFENLYKTISRTYPVNDMNRKNFEKFLSLYNKVKENISTTKTDQEYFNLLKEYLAILENSRIRIINKYTYDDLFNFYKNDTTSIKAKLIQSPQVVDRYKRLISEEKYLDKVSFEVRNGNVMIIYMPNFNLGSLDEDIKNFEDLVSKNENIEKIIIDLSKNHSLNNTYWQTFSSVLIHKDFSSSSLIFYRGNLIKESLEEIKEKKEIFDTAFVKNQASKYKSEPNNINISDYMYYDQINLSLKRNQKYKNRDIYILVNDDTSNEPIKFASILKEASKASLIKNTSQTNTTENDIIYNFPVDYLVLEHSGLLITIDDSYSINDEKPYLEYDRFINTQSPVEEILGQL